MSDALAPVSAGERIEAMDVVRGVALLGILLMNIEAFVGPVATAGLGIDPALRGADRAVDVLVYVVVQGKFYALFSLLFGMGFAVMQQRTESTGRPFGALYLRRTLALLGFGLAHMLLVWSGDVLTFYAVVALAMLVVFRTVPTRQLPWWGVGAFLLSPAMMFGLGVLGELMTRIPEGAKALRDAGDQMAALVEAQRAAYGAGTYVEAVVQRARDLLTMLGNSIAFLPQLLGYFLIGAWFVRSGAIARPEAHERLFRRLRWVALPLGLAMMLASVALMPSIPLGALDLGIGAGMALAAGAGLLMSLGYLAWLVRGVQAGARWLTALAPAGRMALTNYLTQSLVCTFVFYGYGLGYFEQLPRAWQAVFAVVLFAVQVALSTWWLRRFRFGPMEWIWRSVTYGRLPPLRAAAA